MQEALARQSVVQGSSKGPLQSSGDTLKVKTKDSDILQGSWKEMGDRKQCKNKCKQLYILFYIEGLLTF